MSAKKSNPFAGQTAEGMVLVDPEIFGCGEGLFVLRADGDGMRNAGIHSGDWLIFDFEKEAKDGDIVIIPVQGLMLCRRVFFEGNMLRIRREDGETPDVLTENRDIAAVLIGSMRSYRT